MIMSGERQLQLFLRANSEMLGTSSGSYNGHSPFPPSH